MSEENSLEGKPEIANPTVARLRRLVLEYGLTFKQASQSLGLSYGYVRVLASKVGIHRYGSRREDNKNCYSQHEQCPECGFDLRRLEDELVCPLCGASTPLPDQVASLPFGTTYALTSNLAFGKSLGGTAPRQMFKVIARAPAGRQDLPIRATQIQVISNAVDPPIVRSMLRTGSRLFKDLGLDRDTDKCHALADRYGALLRKIGAFIQISKIKIQPYLVARAALYHLLRDINAEKAKQMRKKYPFHGKYLYIIVTLKQLENLEAVASEK